MRNQSFPKTSTCCRDGTNNWRRSWVFRGSNKCSPKKFRDCADPTSVSQDRLGSSALARPQGTREIAQVKIQ